MIDPHIGLGAIISILTMIVGFAGGWATMRVNQKNTSEQLTDLKDNVKEDRETSDHRHDQNVDRIGKLELKIESECLKKNDFREFERRFDAKIDKVEHATANAATRAVGLLLDSMKAGGMLRGGRE